VVFVDALPEKAGNYRYCVIALDVYGSRSRSHLWVGAYWEGEGTATELENKQDAP
jgi:hypothetical protein